jgi:hypothetical protein
LEHAADWGTKPEAKNACRPVGQRDEPEALLACAVPLVAPFKNDCVIVPNVLQDVLINHGSIPAFAHRLHTLPHQIKTTLFARSRSKIMEGLFDEDDDEYDDAEESNTAADAAAAAAATENSGETAIIAPFSTRRSRRPPENGALQFHEGTEDALLIYVRQHHQPHPPHSSAAAAGVLQSIDAFCLDRYVLLQ